MIADVLPRYLEAHAEDGITYEVLRSIVVDGHEAAWVEYRGTVQFDIMRRGREGEPFAGHSFMCECDFREGVGWEQDPDGRVVGLGGERKCLPRQAARHLRVLELRREYRERYAEPGLDSLSERLGEVIEDLKAKVRAGEFVGEDGNGASFWGGYFYLQTLAEIADIYMGHIWKPVRALAHAGQFSLEGAVVQDYREPAPPEWDAYRTVEDDGWQGVMMLPQHRDMESSWRLEVVRPDGESAYPGGDMLPLMHDPVFGPDVEDVAAAEERLAELMAKAMGEESKT